MNPMIEVKLFSGTTSEYLAKNIAEYYPSPGDIKVYRFSDGRCNRRSTSPSGELTSFYSIYLRSGGKPDGTAAHDRCVKRASAGYISAVIPILVMPGKTGKTNHGAHFRQDDRQPAGSRRQPDHDHGLSRRPDTGLLRHPGRPPQKRGHLRTLPAREMDLSNVIFASPDVGGVKRGRALTPNTSAETWSFVISTGNPTKIAEMTVIGDVQDADVILVDDLVDTAGTLAAPLKS